VAYVISALKSLTRDRRNMSERMHVPGTRGLDAALETPDADACVVACPPHPRRGGSRTDARLRAVGERLGEDGVACLRFDYGPRDEGDAEQTDVRDALAYAHRRYDTVGLFGYSFGAGVALLATAAADSGPAALAVLAPPASIGDFDTVAAVEDIVCPLGVVHGERDTTVDWEPVVERARERGASVEAVPGDHFFVGRVDAVASAVVASLVAGLPE
jgi:alpha/beta superfamily hydrolase